MIKKKENNALFHYGLIISLLLAGSIIMISMDKPEKQNIGEALDFCMYISDGICKDKYDTYEDYCEGDGKSVKYYCANERCVIETTHCSDSRICKAGKCIEKEPVIDQEVEASKTICQDGKCILIKGIGEDDCTSDNNCKHKECFEGKCIVFNTPGSSECNIDEDCGCICDTGLCCDGCHYRNSEYVCDASFEKDFGCPWGTNCGGSVGLRYKVRYCSGNDADCNGLISEWEEWSIYVECNEKQLCIDDVAKCKYSQECV